MLCHSYDLLARQTVDRVPFASWRYNEALSKPGGWSCSIRADHEKASVDYLAEERHAVIFTAQAGDGSGGAHGEILFVGALWDLKVTTEDVLVVGGEGLWSYFRDGRRNFRGIPPVTNVTEADDFSYENAPDQFQLVYQLMVFAQSGVAESLGMDVRYPALSGVTRTGVLKASELKAYAQIIEDWAYADDGFDFAVTAEWFNSQPRFHLDLFSPQRGTVLSDPWRLGKHVTRSGDWSRTTGANLIDGVGGSPDGEPIRRSSTGTPKGLRIERVVSFTDVDDGPTLKGLTNGELARANKPVGTANVKIKDFDVCGLDKWKVGDTIPLVGPVSGYTTIDEPNRIVGYEATGTGQDALTVTVDLEPA